MSLNYNELYKKLKDELENNFEAAVAFELITNQPKHKLVIIGSNVVSEKELEYCEKLVKERKSGIPLQYIAGMWEFYSLPYYVGKGVLIPRPDTEVLVDQAIQIANKKDKAKVLDLCAGSGCIGISIAENTTADVICVELSQEAYYYLNKNIKLNNSRVKAINADVFAYKPDYMFDIIVSNPPYIKSGDIPKLQDEVQHEPKMALDGGDSGLDFYKEISRIYFDYIVPSGSIIFEIGEGQGNDVAQILLESGYRDVKTKQDLCGIERIVFAIR